MLFGWADFFQFFDGSSSSFFFNFVGITATIDGKNRTLYISTVKSIEERTRPNLKRTLQELSIENGQELTVADQTTPSTVQIKIKYSVK